MKTQSNTKSCFSDYRWIWNFFLIPILLTILTACPGMEDPLATETDNLPPVLQFTEVIDERSIQFEFDEAIQTVAEDVEIEPALEIASLKPENKRLIVVFSQDQSIGTTYTIKIKVTDDEGNTLSFQKKFIGWDPGAPALLINEINPRGNSSTPDCVELYAVSAGNLENVTLVIGTEENPKDSLIFPAVKIQAGDYIIVHCQPGGIPEEVDEIGSKSDSGGLLASDDAWDFWMRDVPGLPGNNGAVTLYEYTGGPLIDAVLWSDREDKPEEESLGWTADSFPWVKELGLLGAWKAQGDIPLPSETLDVSISTATRSLCRSSMSTDSDSPDDWHTVPTSGKTFGYINTDDVYNLED